MILILFLMGAADLAINNSNKVNTNSTKKYFTILIKK